MLNIILNAYSEIYKKKNSQAEQKILIYKNSVDIIHYKFISPAT